VLANKLMQLDTSKIYSILLMLYAPDLGKEKWICCMSRTLKCKRRYAGLKTNKRKMN
jgi:hypothetical protein